MSDFKTGDLVYFIIPECHLGTLRPLDLSIQKAVVKSVEAKYLYVNISDKDGNYVDYFYPSGVFKSKQDCIDAFKKRLNEL